MTARVFEFGLNPASQIGPDSPCYRPPSWPPPPDWVVSLNDGGEPASRWGDDFFDFSVWAGFSLRFHFVGGREHHCPLIKDKRNQHLLRLLATALLWAPYGAKTWGHAKASFLELRKIVLLCDQNDRFAGDLNRYPALLAQIPGLFKVRTSRAIVRVTLDRLLRLKKDLGVFLLNEESLRNLDKAFKDAKDGPTRQTPYIPPRIWTYQVMRLRTCLDDFHKHRQQVEDCFNFCIEAYAHNFGSLESAIFDEHPDRKLPFTAQSSKNAGALSGRVYHGHFEDTAQRFGISELLRSWISSRGEYLDIRSLGKYLSLISFAGLVYIENFTLQRNQEASLLRADCLHWEQDPTLGRIAVIYGETTKTDPDSDARWPTSPSVEVAVDAMTCVARLRMKCAQANSKVNPTEYDVANPALSHCAFEPWSTQPAKRPYATKPSTSTYQEELAGFPLLFDPEELRITEEDMKVALQFTPNLQNNAKFAVGEVWPLAHHQLRRTSAINMFASDILSDTSIQVIMKHLTVLQTHYYLRNYSRVRFNDEAEQVLLDARYETMGRQIEALVEKHYTTPQRATRKDEIIVLSVQEFKKLVKAGKKGEISFRATRLGGCVKRGHCDYGGIESVARCAGGDGGEPCGDAIFDSRKAESVERQLASVERQIKALDPRSPRAQALKAEMRAFRNFLDGTQD